MPQITQLDNDTTPNNNDLLVTVDIGAGTTKNISREQFLTGAPLPADTVDSQAIEDGAVTGAKLNSTSGVSLLVGRAYSSANVNTTNSGYSTITGASVTFTAEAGQLYLITLTGGTVTNGTGTGTNVTLRVANGTTSMKDTSFSAPAGTRGVCPTVRIFDNSFSAGSVTINARGISASATNVQWDGSGSQFCLTVEKVLSA